MLSHQKTGAAVQVRLSGPQLEDLENWRRSQGKIPARSEALREAIRLLVTPSRAALPDLRRGDCCSGGVRSTRTA